MSCSAQRLCPLLDGGAERWKALLGWAFALLMGFGSTSSFLGDKKKVCGRTVVGEGTPSLGAGSGASQ